MAKLRTDMNPDIGDQTDDGVGQNQDYRKGNNEMEGKSKEISQKPLEMIKAGGKTGTDGPTESAREYPKGGKPKMDANAFNPMNHPPPTYGIGGVGPKMPEND
jgi:hypothetical protein